MASSVGQISSTSFSAGICGTRGDYAESLHRILLSVPSVAYLLSAHLKLVSGLSRGSLPVSFGYVGFDVLGIKTGLSMSQCLKPK